MPALTTTTLGIVAAVVLFGGLVKGTVGFGYAIASTAILATFLDPSTAVVLMILPMLAANLSLLGELRRDELASCIARFWPYVLAAMVGTVLGMLALEAVPAAELTLGLGLFTLAYVLTKQPWVSLPGERWVTETCFTTGLLAKTGLGFLSGVVFGVSNVGVQVVAYLDSLSLDRSTFVGVLAMILVGISGLRVGVAWGLGLYGTGGLLGYSALLALPGVGGVVLGGRLRAHLPERAQLGGVILLLTVIGVRLLSSGFQGL